MYGSQGWVWGRCFLLAVGWGALPGRCALEHGGTWFVLCFAAKSAPGLGLKAAQLSSRPRNGNREAQHGPQGTWKAGKGGGLSSAWGSRSAPTPPAPGCGVGCSCKVLSLFFLQVCPTVGKGPPPARGDSVGLALGTFVQQVPTALGKGTWNGTGAEGWRGLGMFVLVKGAEVGASSMQDPACGVSTRGPCSPHVPTPTVPTAPHPCIPPPSCPHNPQPPLSPHSPIGCLGYGAGSPPLPPA